MCVRSWIPTANKLSLNCLFDIMSTSDDITDSWLYLGDNRGGKCALWWGPITGVVGKLERSSRRTEM